MISTQINVGNKIKYVNMTLWILLGILLVFIVIFTIVKSCFRPKMVSAPATIDFVQEKCGINSKVSLHKYFRHGKAFYFTESPLHNQGQQVAEELKKDTKFFNLCNFRCKCFKKSSHERFETPSSLRCKYHYFYYFYHCHLLHSFNICHKLI